MPVERSNSKHVQDLPGYSGRFSSIDSMDKNYARSWEPPVDYQESLDLDRKWPGDIKYHQKHPGSTIAPTSDHDDSEGNPKTLKRVLVRFAERTSMQGIPYVNVSKTWYAKMVWTILILVAMGMMLLHLYILFESYLSFKKQTQIQLGFNNLKFPTVTLCNVNPLRKSQLRLATPELRQFVDTIKPDNVASSLKKKRPKANQGGSQNPGPSPLPNGQTQTQNGGQGQGNTPSPPPSGRKKRFIDNLEFNFTNTRREFEQSGQKRRPAGQKSTLQEIQNEFKYLFSAQPKNDRVKMGHDLEDMLVSCSFSGVVCNASQFQIFPTSTYGNCFTLENADYVSYRSGPRDGLELILFLNTDEYIATIAPGFGAQVQIHDTNTWPDPDVEGMAISAGMETNIAMRMLTIERMPEPYGVCEYGTAFKTRYGTKYTRQTCQLFCVHEKIVSTCGCYDEERSELYTNINSDTNGTSLSPCKRRKAVECMLNVEADWETGSFTCPCHNPCSETSYQIQSNSRSWPSDAYAKMLVEFLCNNQNETECEKYENMEPRLFSQNFMKINIYFEDLNYEEITEAPAYEDVQFISDVGGTVGLWVGLSALSLAEVFQFIGELFHFLCCVRPNRKRKAQERRKSAERTNNLENHSNRDPQRHHEVGNTPRNNYLY